MITKTSIPSYYKLRLQAQARSAETFKKLNWEPISNTVEQREQVTTYKAIHGLAPKYLTDMFTLCQNNKYALRSNGRKLNLPKPLS